MNDKLEEFTAYLCKIFEEKTYKFIFDKFEEDESYSGSDAINLILSSHLSSMYKCIDVIAKNNLNQHGKEKIRKFFDGMIKLIEEEFSCEWEKIYKKDYYKETK